MSKAFSVLALLGVSAVAALGIAICKCPIPHTEAALAERDIGFLTEQSAAVRQRLKGMQLDAESIRVVTQSVEVDCGLARIALRRGDSDLARRIAACSSSRLWETADHFACKQLHAEAEFHRFSKGISK